MNEPRLTRRAYGRGHGYKIDGFKVPGVTTILNALPKQLTKWAAEKGADHAIEHWDELAALPLMERHKRIMWAHREDVTSKGVRGTRIHALGEKLAHGEAVTVPDDIRLPVEAYARFLDAWQVEAIASETPVGHTRFHYGGTADLWAHIGRIGETSLVDLKTGKGVYSEVVFQLAAYRYAELWQPEGPASEAPLPPVDSVYVAHIMPDTVRLIPVDVDEATFRGFLYVHEVYKRLEQLKAESPLGDALTLDDYPSEVAP